MIVPKKANIKNAPASAANPYAGLNPRSGMEITSAVQNMMLRTTADPLPCAASPNAFVSFGTPSSLKIR